MQANQPHNYSVLGIIRRRETHERAFCLGIFARVPAMFRWMVRICDNMDGFLRKLFRRFSEFSRFPIEHNIETGHFNNSSSNSYAYVVVSASEI